MVAKSERSELCLDHEPTWKGEQGVVQWGVLNSSPLKWVILGCLLVVSVPNVMADSASRLLHNSSEFFPDQPGNEWRYQGRITEGTVNQIADKTFVNVSTVAGSEQVNGVEVTVFHDTNPGDQGPTDSYYRRDAAGILYHGSKPGTKLEKQLVPYQIVRFPLEVPSSFEQLNRPGLNLGLDIDRDGRAENVDVTARVTIFDQESVTVPLGTYQDALRMEAQMDLLVRLSGDGSMVHGFDTMTAWFVRGIGLVKYRERQRVPMLGSSKDRIIEITEELETARVNGLGMSFRRGESSAEGILAHDTLNHELLQVSFPSRLGAHP